MIIHFFYRLLLFFCAFPYGYIIFFRNWVISFFSMVPDPSLSICLYTFSNISSSIPPTMPCCCMYSCTNTFVSSLFRVPLLLSSYLPQIWSIHFDSLSWGFSLLKVAFVLKPEGDGRPKEWSLPPDWLPEPEERRLELKLGESALCVALKFSGLSNLLLSSCLRPGLAVYGLVNDLPGLNCYEPSIFSWKSKLDLCEVGVSNKWRWDSFGDNAENLIPFPLLLYL